jgi:hypothetical protein
LAGVIVLWILFAHGFACGLFATMNRVSIFSLESDGTAVDLAPYSSELILLAALQTFAWTALRLVFAFKIGFGSRRARIGAVVAEAVSAAFWAAMLFMPVGRVPSALVEYLGLDLGDAGILLGIGCSVAAAILLSMPGARAWCRRVSVSAGGTDAQTDRAGGPEAASDQADRLGRAH